jgi:hypothetical protein
MKTLVKKPACCSNTEIARFEALVNERKSNQLDFKNGFCARNCLFLSTIMTTK